MARTVLTVRDPGQQGLEFDLEANFETIDDVNGSKFDASSELVVAVLWNDTIGAIVVTFNDVKDREGRQLTTAEKGISIPAGEHRWRGPFKKAAWAQKSGTDNGEIQVDADASGCKIAIMKCPRLSG